jgi:hypothetical protein
LTGSDAKAADITFEQRVHFLITHVTEIVHVLVALAAETSTLVSDHFGPFHSAWSLDYDVFYRTHRKEPFGKRFLRVHA